MIIKSLLHTYEIPLNIVPEIKTTTSYYFPGVNHLFFNDIHPVTTTLHTLHPQGYTPCIHNVRHPVPTTLHTLYPTSKTVFQTTYVLNGPNGCFLTGILAEISDGIIYNRMPALKAQEKHFFFSLKFVIFSSSRRF